MNSWMLLVNVLVGSAIGGITNELAIRMLFRPLRPWRIGNWRVPFTPGLIPARRDEIARQMGKLVAEHLLTTEGIKKAIAQGELEQNLTRWLENATEHLLSGEHTLRQILQAAVPGVLDGNGNWSEAVRNPVALRWQAFVEHSLRQLGEKKLGELFSAAGRERVETAAGTLGPWMLGRIRQSLHTPQGQKTLQAMIRLLLGGGVFGGFIGMFLHEEKLVEKILPHLDELLQSQELNERLQQFLRAEADRLMDRRTGEIVGWLGEEQVRQWAAALFAKAEAGSLHLIDEPLSKLALPLREALFAEAVPRLARRLVELLEKNAERIFSNLPVSDIVTRQVESFPIERIEEMVIAISGREFRMITILGFILGGVIGLVQGVLTLISS